MKVNLKYWRSGWHQEYCRIWVLGMLVVLVGCVRVDNRLASPPPAEVSVARPLERRIRLFYESTGVTEAFKSVQVRSRVRGFIQRIGFEGGEAVTPATASAGPTASQPIGESGEAESAKFLYEIEPAEYRASLDAALAGEQAAKAAITVAEAQAQVAQAALEQARQEEQRLAELLRRNAISSSEYDKALADSRTAQGQLAAARASVELATAQYSQAMASRMQAELMLGYTSIAAPIAGRITKTQVKEGDLVDNGTHLADIVDTTQVYVNFSVSDREALRFFDQIKGQPAADEDRQAMWAKQQVLLARETDEGYPIQGRLDYVDQQGVDPSTGTLGLRAVFENASGTLLPGLFVRLRLPAKETQEATLVPERSLLRDAKNNLVLVVDAEGSVKPLVVNVKQRIDGWAVIDAQLPADARVVVEGLQKAQSGGRVKPVDVPLELSASWVE